MQILIGCAKTMTDNVRSEAPETTKPAFLDIANRLADQLATYSSDELQAMLHANRQIANENWLRYQEFGLSSTEIPAAYGYDGMVFRKLAPESMSSEDLLYANNHLFIGSFLYGLLRPLDIIHRYRLEGDVELPCAGGESLFNFWKPILTDWFIEKVKADDGILVNLASNEFRNIFDWKRVNKELTVITPEFKVEKDGKLKTVVIYAKMCRGAMARHIIRNRTSDMEQLKDFEFEGFKYESVWNFVLRGCLITNVN